MKKAKRIGIGIVLISIIPLNLFSQEGFSINTGIGIPVGKFGAIGSFDFIGQDVPAQEGAAIGYNLNVKYIYKLTESGLGLPLEVGFFYNGTKNSYKDVIAQYEEQVHIMPTITSFEAPTFYNIPIMTGINYYKKGEGKVSPFGELGVGVDFLIATNVSIEGHTYAEYNSAYVSDKWNYNNPSVRFGFKLTGDIFIDNQFSISASYYLFGGKLNMNEASYQAYTGNTYKDDWSLSGGVSLLTLIVGWRF